MKAEKIVLSFVAIIVGLLVAGVVFFIYQSTKAIPKSQIPTITTIAPTPTPNPSVFLTVDQPSDGSVVTSKTLVISGKTNPDATIVLTTSTDDQVINPTTMGGYSMTTALTDGENILTVTAIAANGEETKKTITVTYSTEEF